MSASAENLLRLCVQRHNEAVKTGKLDPLASLFAETAIIRFEGIAFGPLRGPAAILNGFQQHPPDDALIIDAVASDDRSARCPYRWARDPNAIAGSLEIDVENGLITSLVISVATAMF